jgi:hypothetical protein
MVYEGTAAKKQAALAAAQITVQQAKTENISVSPADVITAKQLIESLAAKSNLPIYAEINSNIISIYPQRSDAGSTAILRSYKEMMDFITSISALPYKMEYSEFCIGSECDNGFNIKLNILGV